ncbi:MAG TPA: hypothetical protein VH439_06215 [Gemmatimonadales bacterium]
MPYIADQAHPALDPASQDAMSAAIGGDQLITDAAGVPAGNKPGYCLGDARTRPAAVAARAERIRWLQDAWRHGRPPADEADPVDTLDAAQLRAIADQAYRDRAERLGNAWRRSR